MYGQFADSLLPAKRQISVTRINKVTMLNADVQ